MTINSLTQRAVKIYDLVVTESDVIATPHNSVIKVTKVDEELTAYYHNISPTFIKDHQQTANELVTVVAEGSLGGP